MSAFDAIPAELREREQWVCWRAEVRDAKPTKIPYRADGKDRASSTDPSTWSTFEAALAAAERFDGLGFVFSADDPFAGVDLDRCRRDLPGLGGPLLEPWAASLVLLLDSYAEWSPSGQGVHVIVRGAPPWLTQRGRRRGPVEAYENGRFFTMTGEHLVGTPEEIR